MGWLINDWPKRAGLKELKKVQTRLVLVQGGLTNVLSHQKKAARLIQNARRLLRQAEKEMKRDAAEN